MLASTCVLAQGALLLAGCAEDSPQMTVPTAPSMPAAPMVPAAAGAGRPGSVAAPMGAPPTQIGSGGTTAPTPTAGGAPSSPMAGTAGAEMGANPAQAGGAGAGDVASGASCIEAVTDFDADGPYEFTKEMVDMVHIWVPMVPAGCKVPIVHYANGTNSTCDPNFPILERLATHGFLGACYENPNTGAGTQAITAYETVMMAHGEMVGNAIGSTGHSQGGGAAFIALARAEEKWGDKMIYAGLAVEPARGYGAQPTDGTWQQFHAKIKSPMFMFSGTADNLVPDMWVADAYNAMPKTNEVYWWSAIGATHVPAPVKWQLQVATPWFRWKLLGEKAACEAFKKLPDGPDWDVRQTMNEAECE